MERFEMSRLSVIQVEQLPAFDILEHIDIEAIITARMQRLVQVWAANDPPAFAQYDVDALEFDPIKINQEASAYFETLLRDRVNQAARSVTLAFATGGDLDAIASRYPGGLPRLDDESDEHYRARVWLSPNLLSPNGSYEAYEFWGFTAAPDLRDVSASAVTGTPNVTIALLADGDPVVAQLLNGEWEISDFPNPIPSSAQITAVRDYITLYSRKPLTDVVQVVAPTVTEVDYVIRYWLFPGWDEDMVREALFTAFAALVERQRYLGYSYTESAIEAALTLPGVSNIRVISPVNPHDPDDHDVVVPEKGVVQVNSVELTFMGRFGVQAFDDNEAV
jgi:phage-related baseplate assembly protein